MIWFIFMLGQIMHCLSQIDGISRTTRATNVPTKSRTEIFKDRWIPIIVRMFICSMVFGVFAGGGAPQVYKAFGSEPPQWTIIVTILLANTGLVGIFIAGLVGFGIDSAMTTFPYFKSYIPPAIDAGTTGG